MLILKWILFVQFSYLLLAFLLTVEVYIREDPRNLCYCK
jgi:hypothetical protein